MADQVLHPDADLADGAWLTDAGGTTLFAAIDEATISDSDFIKSSAGPSLDISRFSFEDYTFGDLVQPVRIQYRFNHISAAYGFMVRLLQGVSEIASRWQETASALQTYELALTDDEFKLITDFDDLRVELIAGFDPLKLFGSDLIGWYDANEGTYTDLGVTAAVATDPVRQWNDKSSYGNHMTNAGGGVRPTLIGTFSGLKKAVSFNNFNRLDRANVAINSNAVSVFAACTLYENATYNYTRLFSVEGAVSDFQSTDGFALAQHDTYAGWRVDHNNMVSLATPYNINFNEPMALGAIVKPNALQLFVNGVMDHENTTSNTPAFDATNTVSIGTRQGANDLKGDIGEIVFVKRVATADEMRMLQTYLKYKHGLYLNPLQRYGSNVVAWYKASEAYSDAGITPAVHGEQIIQLNDLSPNAYHLTRETSKEPSFTSEFNAKYPAMVFDAVTGNGDSLSRSSVDFTGSQAAIFVVASMQTTTDNSGRVVSLQDYNHVDGIILLRDGLSQTVRLYHNNLSHTPLPVTYDLPFIAGGTIKTNELVGYVNNVKSNVITTANVPALDASNTLWIGNNLNNEAWGGSIAEVVLLKSAPTAAELVPLNCYLALSNGIPLTPLEIFGADVVAWYSAKSGVYNNAGTVLAANNDSVQQWNDKSGNNYHVSEATNKPVYTAAGFNGGYPGVVFTTGSPGDVLSNTNFDASVMNTALSMFVVGQVSTNSASRLVGVSKTASNDTDSKAFIIYFDSSGEIFYSHSNGNLSLPATFHRRQPIILGATLVADTIGFSVTHSDDARTGMKLDASGMVLESGSRFIMGASALPNEYFDGIMSEVLVLKCVPTLFQQWLLRHWFHSEWGLAESAVPNPLEIFGPDLAFWVDPTDGVYENAGTDRAESGDGVEQWNDKSGNGYNLTSTVEPTFSSTAFNGGPGLVFTLSPSTNARAGAVLDIAGNELSVFAAVSGTASSYQYARIVGINGGGGDYNSANGIVLGIDFSGTDVLIAQHNFNRAEIAFPFTPSIVGMTVKTNEIKLYVDGAVVDTDTTTNTPAFVNNSLLSVGNSESAENFDGVIGTVVVIKRVPNQSQLIKLHRYLRWRHKL